MTSKNVDIAGEYFQAVQQGDLAKVGELLDEQVVWHQPGANRFSGEHKGRDAVFAMLGGMMEASQGSFAIDKIDALMGNGDMVAASIHFAGRREDASMSMDGVDVLRLKDGKIVEMWLFSGDQVAEDAFWGQ
ncbi:nuclear transport factor 2 family protein [Streptomyces sp. ME19-01-6]|uniref:nuclear transport factor 2 family protein n=1 Tax=Streptomyces sp. ME19-01-6 TaxID=3028686 RepID=UPI0029B68220|nr:nuclear transport factor 2 family protein [Streptomyces sp. ME19-01-6]MDX3229967.1 nuclear transport factor 2 family protein [Streptomyces sp. ME19-01-6]